MNKIYSVLLLIVLGLTLSNCNKNNDPDPVPLRDYAVQYANDIADIEQFLKTHSITVTDHPGFADDMNVAYDAVDEGDPTAIWNDSRLAYKEVEQNSITYKLYYLKLRDGGGASGTNLPPCDVDAVLTSYSGSYLFHLNDENGVDQLKTYEFESVPYPQSDIPLENVVKGWREIFPMFKPGDFFAVNGEPTVYTNFGAGIMFLPSGLGYYAGGSGAIPAYSPLIFSFKLYEITRLDQDQDGIPSWLEDNDHDGHLTIIPISAANTANTNDDDTDGDGAPDYLDLDDDGDFVLTKTETQRPGTPVTYYSYNGAAVDDPATPYDDTQGIPACPIGNDPVDYTTPDRLRRHRNPDCH